MNKLITVASINASRAWGGAPRPSMPLKRSVLPESYDESVTNAVYQFVEDINCIHKSEELARAFRAGVNWQRNKMAQAFATMEKLYELLPEGEAKTIVEDFINS